MHVRPSSKFPSHLIIALVNILGTRCEYEGSTVRTSIHKTEEEEEEEEEKSALCNSLSLPNCLTCIYACAARTSHRFFCSNACLNLNIHHSSLSLLQRIYTRAHSHRFFRKVSRLLCVSLGTARGCCRCRKRIVCHERSQSVSQHVLIS